MLDFLLNTTTITTAVNSSRFLNYLSNRKGYSLLSANISANIQ